MEFWKGARTLTAVFFILGFASLGFAVKLVFDHLKEAQRVHIKVLKVEQDIALANSEIEARQSEVATIKAQADALQAEVNERQALIDAALVEIGGLKAALEKKGKYKV